MHFSEAMTMIIVVVLITMNLSHNFLVQWEQSKLNQEKAIRETIISILKPWYGCMN